MFVRGIVFVVIFCSHLMYLYLSLCAGKRVGYNNMIYDEVEIERIARVAGKFQDDLLRGLRFFVKHWFGLTPVTRLFSVVTAFTCR